MRQSSLIVYAGLLALGLGGCGASPFGGGSETTVEEVPVEAPSPVAQAPFSEPTVTAQASPAGVLPPDLIGSTDANQRVRAIQSNRPDPFALIQTTPTVQIPVEETASPQQSPPQTAQTIPVLPNLPRVGGVPGASPGATTPGGAAPGQTSPSAVAALPPAPPQPTLAKAVQVSGVVQVGSTLHAIVNAPNEPSSRYVRVGQRLSNGQVLVKRIEMNGGAVPIVILEQNGIEVSTAVGEGGQPATDSPTAVVPVPQSVAFQPL
ncbi:hypothetical protein IQ268_00685 [Oculatella sp. LEGE 06141]|uniref:hypothetical protein n=1 Tax=Oculatella sp. LEGE 06141 TaxID=1828648 RepID=UPI00187E48AB|nr:hypothetical protein [Oculatella sp. LEGE 06141]MBE9177090.1 hypothetical protein [Oculatella sp. LEGE 06141]